VSRTKDAASRTGQKPPPLPQAGQRDSGTQLVGPQPAGSQPATTHFEPLPLGSDAFMPPLAPADETPEAGPHRWLAPAAAVGVVAVMAAVLGLTLWPRDPVEITPEPASAAATGRASSRVPSASPSRAPADPASGSAAASAARPAHAVAAPAAEPDGLARAPGAVAFAAAAPPPAPPVAAATPERATVDSRGTRSRRGSRNKEPSIDKPSRAQVIAAMSGVQRRVKACLPSGRGSTTADVKIIGKTGRVTTAQISGPKGEVGSCIARAVRKAKFPKFSAESISIRYPMAF
jgi:hypothetical protein